MIYNTLRRAYHHTQKFLGHAYREGRKYAKGFDQFMNIAGRTVLTLQPQIDEVHSPRGAKSLDPRPSVRGRAMGAHSTGERYVSHLGKNVPELNLR